MLARARPHVDEVVGGAHRALVVLDHEHRVADVAQSLERPDQPLVVALVQPDRRLVEDVQHAHERMISGRDFSDFDKRAEPLELDGDLKPDMGSLTLSSVNFNKQASINEPDMIQALARRMKERGISPELEAFDLGMVNYARYLAKKSLITPPYYFNLLLGNIACAQADLLHAGIMIRDLPERSLWSLAGIGDSQLSMNSVAIAAGGGVRVGLEDTIFFDKQRTRLARNSDLLKRIHTIASDHERTVMTAKVLRRLLNLKEGNGRYGRNTERRNPELLWVRELYERNVAPDDKSSHQYLH